MEVYCSVGKLVGVEVPAHSVPTASLEAEVAESPSAMDRMIDSLAKPTATDVVVVASRP